MPEVTDPRLLNMLNAGQPAPMGPAPMNVQPQPFPGPRPGPVLPRVENSTVPQQHSAARLGLDRNADARAGQSQAMEAERLRIAKEKAEADRIAREANAGVDTTASQDQAVGHAIMLRQGLKVLNDVRSKAPEQIQPGWKEFGVAYLTGDDPTLTGLVQGEQRQRASNAYRGVVESAIWLMTGAAAPADQVQRIYSTLSPTAADKPGVLQDKREQLLTFIRQAEARAGAAKLKLDNKTPYTEDDLAALKELKEQANIIYGDEQAGPEAKAQLSNEKVTIPVPPEMQQEHTAFFSDPAHARGRLSVGQYLQFRKQLQDKYDYGQGQMDFMGAEDFVKAYNEGKPVEFNIAPEERELGNVGKLIADASDSDVGAGLKSYASAMTLGAPELLAGKGGRVASALVDEAHPKSALAGEVLGSIAPGLAIEKGLAKGATRFLGKEVGDRTTRIGADMTANAALGGITELNQTGDMDAAMSAAALGAGGAAAGRSVAKGFAELKPKEFREGLEALGPQDILDDAGKKIGTVKGVDLTTPQRMGAERAEEFFEGIPTVAPARQKAVDDWNRHNSARVLSRVGLKLPKDIKPGQHANAYVHQALGKEYDKIAPSIKGTVDKDWQTALAAIRNDALKAPRGKSVPADVKEMWQHMEDAAASLNVGGKFDYASYKKFSQQVREWQRFWASSKIGTDEVPSPVMNQMARRAEDLLTQARALVSRANPDAGARLKKIDTAWRHQMINDIASLGAAKQNRGVAAPAEWLNAVERLDFSKNRSATSQNKAFEQKYGQHAMDVLGKKPSRGASLLGTGALGYTVGGAVLSPALAATYAPGIKRLTQAITDGQLGKKLDNLSPEVVKKQFPELPTDVIKQIMATYIREKAMGK